MYRSNNRDIHMIVYPSMPHAFLSFDTTMKEAEQTVKDAAELLMQLINL